MAGRAEYRRGQGIVPYGVGAIVDFPEESLMAAGLDMWPHVSPGTELHIKNERSNAMRINDGRLQRRLSGQLGKKISGFYTPAEAPAISRGFADANTPDLARVDMPFIRFPEWHFCPRCRTLWKVPWNAARHSDELKCSSDNRYAKGEGKTCAKLPKFQRKSLVPVRFLVACSRGHIMDFPWQKWVHRGRDNCGSGSGELFLIATGAAGLAGLEVRCHRCKAQRTMNGAFGQPGQAFQKIWPNGACPGKRPWLGPDPAHDQQGCPSLPTTVQRGAANTYFANVVNSILIPPYSQLLRQILDRPDVWNVIEVLPLVDGKLPDAPLKQIAINHSIDPQIFIQAVQERYGASDDEHNSPVSEQEYRLAEYKAFHGQRPPSSERHDFDLKPMATSVYSEMFQSFFETIVLIPRLRETRVLMGFTRIMPSNAPDMISEMSIAELNWLPAMEVRGEGIFLTLRREKLDQWTIINEGRDITPLTRCKTIDKRQANVLAERKMDPRPISAEFLLLHTLAHVLIKQLIFDCGYDSSSLRERLYVGGDDNNKMAGLLIYTASGDSEGTLGGLVRQGLPGRLENTLTAAINSANMCSSDPLCIESEGQGVNGLNMAACHACSLLPETSCEEGNRLLDRAMLTGQPSSPELGYFSDLVQ